MENPCCIILGLKVNHRNANAPRLQEALTKYGCNIRLRVGLHETSEIYCSDEGLILLQIAGGMEVAEKMLADLNALEGVSVKMMTL